MEWNRKPRNGLTTIWSANHWQNRKDYPLEKSLFNKLCWENGTAVFSRMITGPLSYTLHKNKLKMDERPECETGNHQNPRGEYRQQPL